ncbi:MAG: transcriptional activator NhaR [Vicinamibacterales bacterium]|jgi:LysR family transcriptional activator of nhaA|nr:transcriptional activator NhaR [Vicinamibacterales bacterium]
MQWLNYHHLLYFWTVAREGSVVRAAEALSLTQPTISGQIRALEDALGEKLFERSGRRLVLTEVGRIAYRYAEEIFTLGRELLNTLDDRPTGRPLRLVVGVADVMPKLIVRRLIEPALRLPEGVQVICREDKSDRLLAGLSLHELDVVLADTPMTQGVSVRAFNHLLGESGVSILGAKALAQKYRRQFPASLDQAPMLLPTANTVVRRSLDQFFDTHGIRPRIVAELEDSALLKSFGEGGLGLFPMASVIDKDVCRQFGVQVVGQLEQVRERFYAISVEKKLKHPAVVAISEHARAQLFGTQAEA